MVKSRRRASCSAVPKTLSSVIKRSGVVQHRFSGCSSGLVPTLFFDQRIRRIGCLLGLDPCCLFDFDRIGAESGDFDQLAALEIDVRQPESPANQAAIAEDGPDLARVGGGGHVEVLGLLPKQKVSHAPADQIGLMAMLTQTSDYFQSVGVQERWRDFGRRRARLPGR